EGAADTRGGNVQAEGGSLCLSQEALHPAAANPLAVLQQQLNLKQGLNLKGETALVVFAPIAGENEPRAMALIPVADYKAFLTNFADVKKDGEADTFALQADGEPLFAEQWGEYAAITPWKDLLAEKPQGLQVNGVIAKQFQEKDLTVYVSLKPVREKILPQVQQIRQMLENMPAADNPGGGMPGAFQKAMGVHMFAGVESFLTQTQASALSLNVTPAGVSSTLSVEFDAASPWGKSIQTVENTDGSLLTGLPQDNYLAFAGVSLSGGRLWSMFNALYSEPMKAVKLDEADTKSLQAAMAGYEKMLTAMNRMTFALVTPPAGTPPTAGLLRAVTIIDGDAKTLLSANQAVMENQNAFMKATGTPGISMKTSFQPNVKTLDNVAMGQFTTEVAIDTNAGVDPTAAQILQFLYGKGMSILIGAVNDKTVVSGMGVDDAQLQKTIATAKQGQAPLSTDAAIKNVAKELPQKRFAVGYVAVANMITTGLDIASQLGAAPPIKLPADLPPVGVSAATEGSALRFDAHIPSPLIEALVSTGLQMAMQKAQQQKPAGGL
ncbi:MAG TPA: hypothetical protein VHP11_05155, partial [Tepidisphaeraceae bacterium]|nr:hypothetical protein [Tepidisphaeraceae bacterium]